MTELLSLDQIPHEQTEALLDAAFGTDRRGRTAYLLRCGSTAIPELSFAITDNGALVGTIQCWPVQIGGAKLVLVGPVAVLPERQGQGIGHRLMYASLDATARLGEPAMVMIGDPEYYERFGFTAAETSGWLLPGPWEPRRLLARNVGGHSLPETGMLERADAL
ncbi:N-acetyltransferase [Sphingorhabdus pulchriflava]|uniref:N-acetyltransferase n=1 Tax=Sphingorhabdus pulchriflava TaxID=2292257 RepID=A0A371BHJ7_9SPHN|nr:N-acetyltransferase [Sphingorhabdus pulchriflava]RDV07056.1 N-acetyltransferase [Sphingorhabdus pulchriflava]